MALFWKQRLSDSIRSTSCLWVQTNAAPELWMVVSSGWGFLGKRRGCWQRLSGAEGSPHRVPVGAPPGKVRDRWKEQQSYLIHQLSCLFSIIFFSFGRKIVLRLDRKHRRQITQHDSGFKAAESYHMDTNPISCKATPNPNVCNQWGQHAHHKIHLFRFDRMRFAKGELNWNNTRQIHWEPTESITKSAWASATDPETQWKTSRQTTWMPKLT